jgi:hypothetical protein
MTLVEHGVGLCAAPGNPPLGQRATVVSVNHHLMIKETETVRKLNKNKYKLLRSRNKAKCEEVLLSHLRAIGRRILLAPQCREGCFCPDSLCCFVNCENEINTLFRLV